MTLNSVVFIFAFMPIVLLLFYGARFFLRGTAQANTCKVLLLIASIVFFSWVAQQYLPLLFALIALNYLAALLMHRTQWKRTVLAAAIVIDVAALAFYKYFNFFGEQLDLLCNFGFVSLDIIQPLGISFFVFSLISYVVDVYRRTIEADKNLLNVALWASFFPKMTSGPIVRYADMFSENADLSASPSSHTPLENLSYGTRKFVIGLGKKVIIADSLGVIVDQIFTAQTTGVDTPTAWLGIICYTFQIFFDFAGYSDMAIGIAAMFGFRFKENFNYPYIAKTIGEFWHRWHISLSTWLRDYLYFPLGGSRRGNVYFNLLVVFLVSGLWHGADWHFVVWGLWYAAFMILDRIYRTHAHRLNIPDGFLWAGTMLVVVLGWVFFRAQDMPQAISYIGTLFGIGESSSQFFGFFYYCTPRTAFLLIVAVLCSTPIFDKARQRHDGTLAWEAVRCLGIPALFVIAVLFMINSTYSPFLYAQF